MTVVSDEAQQGLLTEVTLRVIGSETAQDHALGAATLYLYDTTDFADEGGQLLIQVDLTETYVLSYKAKDDDFNTVTLTGTLPVAVDAETQVFVYPLATEKWAQVKLDEDEEPIVARVPYNLSSGVDEGIRDPGTYESAMVQLKGIEYVLVDMPGKEDYLDGTSLDPTTVPPAGSSSISTAPVISASAGYNSIFVSWNPVMPDDTSYTGLVTYEVHVSGTSGFTPTTGTLYARTISPNILITSMPSGSALSTSAPTYVLIRAYTSNQVSPWSNQTSATALAGANPADIAALQAKFPINTVDIATGAVIGVKITDGTITTAKIGSSQITSSLIADSSIATLDLADGAVTALKITDGTITTSKIAAAQITNPLLASLAVASANLQDGAVTTAKITDGNITTAKIGANQVTTTTIADNQITTPKIVANAITATQLAAGAVTANKLNVIIGGGNMVPDSSFETGTTAGWVSQGAGVVTNDPAHVYSGSRALKVVVSSASGQFQGTALNLPGGPVTNGTYTYSVWVFALTAMTLRVVMYDGASQGPSTQTAVTANTWTRLSVSSTWTSANMALIVDTGTIAQSGTFFIDSVQLEQGDVPTAYAPKTDEILPGTIVANQIAANTITASQIATGTITAAQIAAGTITATQLAANSVTATQLAAGAVTANKLAVIIGGGNLLDNSSYEGTVLFDGSVNSVGWGGAYGARAPEAYDTTNFFRGTRSVKISPATNGDGTAWVFPTIAIQSGQTYTVSIYVKILSGTETPTGWTLQQTTPSYIITGGATMTGGSTTAIAAGNGWYRIVSTFTSTSAGNFRPALFNSTGTTANNTTFVVDAAQVEFGDVVTAYAPRVDEILPGSILASMIQADSITSTQIAASAITSSEIAAGAVTASKLTVTNLSNLIDDPGFERGGGSWSLGGGATIATTGTPANGGTKVVQVASSGATISSVYIPEAAGIRVLPGEVYWCFAQVRKTTTGTTGSVQFDATFSLDGASQVVTHVGGSPMLLSSMTQNVWTTFAGQVTVPAGKNFMVPRFHVLSSVPAGQTIEFDDFVIRKANDASLVVDGTITTNKLASGAVTTNKLSVIVGGGNLVPDSSFETTAGYSGQSGWVVQGGAAGVKDTAQRRTGAQSLKITPNAVENWGYYATDGGVQGSLTRFTGTLGVTYTASIWIYADTAQSMALYNYGSPNVAGPTVAVAANTWTRLTVSYVHGASNFISPRVPGRATALLGNFWMDNFQIEEGDVATAYAPKTDEILPGTIVANQVATDTLTANEIAANAITTNEISANTIQAGDIQALTLTANEIAANTIVAAKIAAGTITATEIAAGTITATQIAAGTITTTLLSATAIDGMTVTGSLLRTAASGARVEIGSSGTQEFVKLYTGGVNETTPGTFQTLSTYGIQLNGPIASTTPAGNYRPGIKISDTSMTFTAKSNGSSQIQVFGGMQLMDQGLSGASGVGFSFPGDSWVTTDVTHNGLGGTAMFRADTIRILYPPTTTSATNVRMNGTGDLLLVTSTTKSKIDPQRMDLDRLKALTEIPVVDWIDREEYKENKRKKTGLRRIPGVLAEDVAAIDPAFANYFNDELQGVQYDRLALAALPLIKDLYSRIEKLEQQLATV